MRRLQTFSQLGMQRGSMGNGTAECFLAIYSPQLGWVWNETNSRVSLLCQLCNCVLKPGRRPITPPTPLYPYPSERNVTASTIDTNSLICVCMCVQSSHTTTNTCMEEGLQTTLCVFWQGVLVDREKKLLCFLKPLASRRSCQEGILLFYSVFCSRRIIQRKRLPNRL